MNEVTEMQRCMENAQGHEVEICLVNDNNIFKSSCIKGKCVGFTKPIDNEPEIATIDISVKGYSCIFEFKEEEIKEIVVKD